jgi:hypothetical protein
MDGWSHLAAPIATCADRHFTVVSLCWKGVHIGMRLSMPLRVCGRVVQRDSQAPVIEAPPRARTCEHQYMYSYEVLTTHRCACVPRLQICTSPGIPDAMDELFGIGRSRFRHGIAGAIDEEICG